MIKKTITYLDYNDVERTESFYFNLNEDEIAEMELTTNGGLAETIKAIVDAKDTAAIVKIFKGIILKSYGEKSADGKYFKKSEELSMAFSHTKAYSKLFMELATDADAASKFINGIMPAARVKAAAENH